MDALSTLPLLVENVLPLSTAQNPSPLAPPDELEDADYDCESQLVMMEDEEEHELSKSVHDMNDRGEIYEICLK